MRAVVTGGAGFIGSHLCRALLAEGWEVLSIDDYSTGRMSNHVDLDNSWRFNALAMDIRHDGIKHYLNGADVIFHNAATKMSVARRDPRLALDVNAWGTYKLLKHCKALGVNKFIHASTGSVYGEPIYFPQDENHPLRPCSVYGVTKLAGESYCNLFRDIQYLSDLRKKYDFVWHEDVIAYIRITGKT